MHLPEPVSGPAMAQFNRIGSFGGFVISPVLSSVFLIRTIQD